MEETVEPVSNLPAKSGTEPRKQKKVWLLTYCPAETYISAEMLKESNIIVDECHSTCDRVINFTYIHVPKKCRIGQIEKFLEKVQMSHGIVKKEVFGYEPISSHSNEGGADSRIQEHVAFKMLLKHFQEGKTSFFPWTDGERILKRGYLFQAADLIRDTISLEYQTKSQIIKYTKTLEEKVRSTQGHLALYLRVSEERSELRIENARLKRKIYEMESCDLHAENARLKQRIAELESATNGV